MLTSIEQNSSAKQPLTQSELQNWQQKQSIGLQGKLKWPIHIGTLLLYIALLLISYLEGSSRNSEVSRSHQLYVTPQGLFFAIWGVIFTTVGISILVNFYTNYWSPKTHLSFAISNVLSGTWTFVFDNGSLQAVVVASIFLIGLAISVLTTWTFMGEYPSEKKPIIIYISRNIFAFYLGWVVAAANLGIGIDMVYWWNISKQAQLIIFWIMAPLCALFVAALNIYRQKLSGFLSCFCFLISVGWAFVGAGLSSSHCLSGPQSDC